MALHDRKLTGWVQPITSLDDEPEMSAAALKAAFDSNTNELKPALNGVIDDLAGAGGAGEIGTSPIEGVTGTDVQTMLAFLKGLIDLRDPTANVDNKLALKADKTTVAAMVKSVAFNAQTGVFTITEQGGTVHTIDTVLEKVPMSCRLDGQEFVLTLEDGTEQRVSLAAFLTPQEFVDSDTIDFQVVGSTIKAAVKTGSITLSMLESTVLTTLQGYQTAAETAAGNASASEQNAAAHKNAAAGSAQTASEKASEAGGQAVNAKSWAVGGTGTRAGEDADNAKYYKEKAAASATQAGSSETQASLHAANAQNSKTAAEKSASAAKTSETNAKASETAAKASETAAKNSQDAAKTSETAAKASETAAGNAKTAAEAAKTAAQTAGTAAQGSATAAGQSAGAAAQSAANAAASATTAGSEADRAKAEADRAGEIVGGDFATKSQAQGYADTAEQNAKDYADEQIAAIPTPDVSGQIGAHNTSAQAHEDIRTALAGKVTTEQMNSAISAAIGDAIGGSY